MCGRAYEDVLHYAVDIAQKGFEDAPKIDISQINIKATTEEGLGFTGSGEGISSQAICAIEKITNMTSYKVADSEEGCAGCGGCKKHEE